MKADIFRQNFWLFDGLFAIAFGLWLGYGTQLIADSGEIFFNKVVIASLIGTFSYALALLLGVLISKTSRKIPSWIWLSVIGAVVFAFNKYFIWYSIENWNHEKSATLFNYVLERFHQQLISLIFISVISMIPLFLFFLVVRTFIYFIKGSSERFSKL